MLGSPNGIRFVGDGRNLPNELKEPSAIIQDIAEWWLDSFVFLFLFYYYYYYYYYFVVV